MTASSAMRLPIFLALLPLAACDPGQEQASAPRPDETASRPAPATVPAAPPPASQEKARKDAATPAPSIPPSAIGRWAGLADDCADDAAESALTVTPDQLLFHESAGAVRAVDPVDGGVAVQADFTGEGQSWTRRIVLRPAADGQRLTVANDGIDVTRKRCGA